MIRIETKPSLHRRVHRQAPVTRRSATETRRSGAAHGNSRSERSAGRNCSSSRPRPSWHGWKSAAARRRSRTSTTRSSGKDDPQGCRRRQAKTRRSQADQGRLSEGDRAGAASRRADGAGGQVAQAEGSPRLPTRRPRRHGRFSRKFKRRSPSKNSRIRNSRIRTRRTRTSRSRIRRTSRRTTSRRRTSRRKTSRRRTSRRKIRNRRSRTSRSKSDEQKQDQKQPQPQVSRDRIEEALRKVRERQQEKRERDRKMKARVFGRVPVEKDW